MITEDYVSFEVAKLLAEKGVEDDCEYTGWIGESGNHYYPDDTYLDDDEMIAAQKDRKEFIPLISLQMAVKWLREVHKIEVRVIYDNEKSSWYGACNPMNEPLQILLGFNCESNSYEEACEEAIKYCLENLI